MTADFVKCEECDKCGYNYYSGYNPPDWRFVVRCHYPVPILRSESEIKKLPEGGKLSRWNYNLEFSRHMKKLKGYISEADGEKIILDCPKI